MSSPAPIHWQKIGNEAGVKKEEKEKKDA